TVLLWARDIHPETEKWETLESSLKTLLTLLRHCVNGGTLPHYFLRDFNLFNKRYGEGNGFYERLALQVLNKEEELLEVDPELFISLRLSKEVSECPGAFSRIEASLWEFKVSHWKALKELEEEELYKREEEHLGDRSCPARWQQNKAPRHFDAAIAELNQNERQSPQCQGKAEVPVRDGCLILGRPYCRKICNGDHMDADERFDEICEVQDSSSLGNAELNHK
ncbi:unnamed protein product, partial [Caretta caretta]